VLGLVDLATDINVIRVYFGEEGQEGFGWMMLGMVVASIGLQLVGVLMQNGLRGGWRKLLRESLIVVSGLKPGIDAMRVVSNKKPERYQVRGHAERAQTTPPHHSPFAQVMDAKTDHNLTKGIEMFCESIPGERGQNECLPISNSNPEPPPVLAQAASCRPWLSCEPAGVGDRRG
jgi:hypothetical protein